MKKLILAFLLFPLYKAQAVVVPSPFTVKGSSVLVVTSDSNGNVVLKGSMTTTAMSVGASGITFNDGSNTTSASGANAWKASGQMITAQESSVTVPSQEIVGGVTISSKTILLPSAGNITAGSVSLSSGGLAGGSLASVTVPSSLLSGALPAVSGASLTNVQVLIASSAFTNASTVTVTGLTPANAYEIFFEFSSTGATGGYLEIKTNGSNSWTWNSISNNGNVSSVGNGGPTDWACAIESGVPIDTYANLGEFIGHYSISTDPQRTTLHFTSLFSYSQGGSQALNSGTGGGLNNGTTSAGYSLYFQYVALCTAETGPLADMDGKIFVYRVQ